jgi:hypothetical protein
MSISRYVWRRLRMANKFKGIFIIIPHPTEETLPEYMARVEKWKEEDYVVDAFIGVDYLGNSGIRVLFSSDVSFLL